MCDGSRCVIVCGVMCHCVCWNGHRRTKAGVEEEEVCNVSGVCGLLSLCGVSVVCV